jgi:hypothetical protein
MDTWDVRFNSGNFLDDNSHFELDDYKFAKEEFMYKFKGASNDYVLNGNKFQTSLLPDLYPFAIIFKFKNEKLTSFSIELPKINLTESDYTLTYQNYLKRLTKQYGNSIYQTPLSGVEKKEKIATFMRAIWETERTKILLELNIKGNEGQLHIDFESNIVID